MIIQQMEWRRLYRHESAQQRTWDLTVRGVRDMVIRIPETLEGILLESTDDPIEDLIVAMSVKPKDQKAARAALKFLLEDGYLVYNDRVLYIRNFLKAQTGDECADPPPPPAPAARTVSPELSAKRSEAGRQGGKAAQAAKQLASSKFEQTAPHAAEQNEQTASSKIEQLASAREDPEEKKREEETKLPRISGDQILKPLARTGSEVGVGANGQANGEAKRDPKAMADHWLRSPADAAFVYGSLEVWPEVRAIAEAFERTWGRSDAPRSPADSRAKLILDRFVEGYTVAQIVLAVERSKLAKFMQDNPQNRSLVTILKEGERIDKLMAMTEGARAAGDKGPKQPNGGDWRPEIE